MRERALWTFVITACAFLIPALVAVLSMDRFALHLAMNAHHGGSPDRVLSVATYLADGWVTTIIALLMLFVSLRAFLMMSVSAAVSAIVTQTLKHTAFSDVDRPSEFLAHMPGLHLVPWVELNHHNSFPSGHSTAAFSMCLAGAVIIGRRMPAIALAMAAVFLGYCRVYLSQHFTEDVLAGATVGMLTAIAAYYLFYRGKLAANTRLDRSPFRR